MRPHLRARGALLAALALGALLAALLARPAPARAASDGRGAFLELSIHSSHIGADDPPRDPPEGSVFVDEDGVGGALTVGYGFTPSFPVRLVLSGAGHETSDPDVDFSLASATIEAAYVFRAGQPVRPYLFAGLGGYSMESRRDEFRFETTGPGASAGVGLLCFLGRHPAFDFALRVDFINWEETKAEIEMPSGATVTVETPIEEEGTAAKFLAGFGWWF